MCGNLPLRVFFSLIQSVSHFQYKFFSWRKFIFQFFIKLLNIVLQMNPLWNICFCRFDDIVEVDFISFPICADRFIKRDFMAAFFSGAQIHQDFICNPLVVASFFDCFDQLDISVREYHPTQLYRPVFLELYVSLQSTSYQKNLKKKIISQSIRQS